MVWWCWSSTDVTDDVTNSDGPTTLSPIPISTNLSVSGYEYNSFRLPYLIRAPTHYCTVPQCRIQWVLNPVDDDVNLQVQYTAMIFANIVQVLEG